MYLFLFVSFCGSSQQKAHTTYYLKKSGEQYQCGHIKQRSYPNNMSLEEQIEKLGLTGSASRIAVPPQVFSVSLLENNNYDCAVVESDYDQEARNAAIKNKHNKKNAKHGHGRQWFMTGRPPIEQGPLVIVPEKSNNKLFKTTIDLVEMATQVNHVWSDRILFARTIRPPFQQQQQQQQPQQHSTTGLWSLLQEGETNNAISMVLSLWNYLPLSSKDEYLGNADTSTLDLELPMGSYVALYHPLLVPNDMWETSKSTKTKTTTTTTARPLLMLRCDNPQCIRIFENEKAWRKARETLLPSDHPTPTPTSNDGNSTAAQLKDQGNAAFGKKAYLAALRFYQQALQIASTESSSEDDSNDIAISCLGNMAEACLQSGRYEQAESFSRQILRQYDPNHFKAQFRLVRALLYQNQPNEAKDIVMDLRKKYPKNSGSLQSLLGECLQAIMESRGMYNISKMLGEATLSPILPFHADYLSPQIDLGVTVVRPSDGGTYRGVLAKEDISEGTLLTASRSFAFAYYQHSSADDHDDASRKKYLYEVSQVHQAVSMILKNPSLGKAFYCLEAAGEVPTTADDNTTNAKSAEPSETIIDLAKIRSILESNRFGVDLDNGPASPFELKAPSEQQQDSSDDFFGVGLWLRESMFNHSCTPNCTWAQIGNYMFMYASKPIAKGSELCISYVHPALSFQDRKERFQRWSGGKGFECGCEWCHWMRQNPEVQAMNEEVKEAQRLGHAISPSRRAQIQKAHQNTSHDVPDRFQQTMYNIHMMDALQRASRGDRRGTLESVQAAVELGYAIRGGLRQETRVQDLCVLAAAHMTCNQDDQAKAALETLVEHQVVLPSLTEFQTFVMMSSVPIWDRYQSEPFMKRWATLNKTVWQARSKQLK